MITQPPGLLDLPRTLLAKLAWMDLTYQLDLGSDHWLGFVTWSPDMSIEENRARWGAHAATIAEHPVSGANVIHRCKTETGYHEGCIHFKTPATALWVEPHRGHCWDVLSWNPLTLHPSLQSHCPCGDHGHIQGGRWVRS